MRADSSDTRPKGRATDDGEVCDWHRDKSNISHQYLFSLGSHTGGDIVVRDDGAHRETQRFNYHNTLVESEGANPPTPRVLAMDGRFEHRLGAFTGTRFSVVFYKVYDSRWDEPRPHKWPPAFVWDPGR